MPVTMPAGLSARRSSYYGPGSAGADPSLRDRLLERDPDGHLQVGALPRPAIATGAASIVHAEERLEQFLRLDLLPPARRREAKGAV